MSRTIRPYIRGAAFHITARTNGGAWFKHCEDRIEQIIIDGVRSSDALLIAHAVMPNHFHIVLRQGARPLGWIMQPVMRRAALCAQRVHARQGHIFERPFRSHACATADHLRRAIVYTHLNPHRAALCDESGFYRWCSQRRVDGDEFCATMDVPFVTRLFARTCVDSDADSLSDYLAYVGWRLQRDAAKVGAIACADVEPIATAGDAYFERHFVASSDRMALPLSDLRDHAKCLLRAIDGTMCLEDLRGSYLSRKKSAIRKQLIAGLLQAGYRVTAISRFLRVSDTTVSKVASEMRYATISGGRLSA